MWTSSESSLKHGLSCVEPFFFLYDLSHYRLEIGSSVARCMEMVFFSPSCRNCSVICLTPINLYVVRYLGSNFLRQSTEHFSVVDGKSGAYLGWPRHLHWISGRVDRGDRDFILFFLRQLYVLVDFYTKYVWQTWLLQSGLQWRYRVVIWHQTGASLAKVAGPGGVRQ